MRKTVSILALLLLLSTTAFAADAMYRLMHNDHDALILGEVTEVGEEFCSITVHDTIVSAKNLREDSQVEQSTPESIRLSLKDFCFVGYYDSSGLLLNPPPIPVVGDYILASVNNSVVDGYTVAWGAYRVDSLDKATLSIVLPESASDGFKADAAALEYFIRSDGQSTEFAFHESTVTVQNESGEEVIYQAPKQEPQPTPTEEELQMIMPVEEPVPEIEPIAEPVAAPTGGSAAKTVSVIIYSLVAILFIAGFVLLVKRYRRGDGTPVDDEEEKE